MDACPLEHAREEPGAAADTSTGTTSTARDARWWRSRFRPAPADPPQGRD